MMKKEQAFKIANNIYKGRFEMAANGCFDLSMQEFAVLLMLADSPLAKDHLEKYYWELKEEI